MKEAKAHGYSAIALTDYASLSGVPHFVSTAKEKGLKNIIGEDFLVEDYLFTFIVINETGYINLLKINYAFQSKELTLDFVKNNNEGLVVVLGSNNRLIRNEFDDVNFGKKIAKLSRGISNFYLGLEVSTKSYMDDFRDFAYSHGYNLVAFPFVKYVKKEDAITLRMLEAIETKEVLTEKKAVGDEYLYSLEEIKGLYSSQEIARIF